MRPDRRLLLFAVSDAPSRGGRPGPHRATSRKISGRCRCASSSATADAGQPDRRRVRAAGDVRRTHPRRGCGLGGILRPTGVGTLVAEGKRLIEVDGKEYLLETGLRAQFALVHAFLADYLGNLTYALTARNFNPSWRWRPTP